MSVKQLDCLSKNLIFLDLSGKDKHDVISQMVHLMKQQKAIDDEKDFLKEVFQREALGCTAIGGCVAIPHARTRTVKKIVIAFARLTPAVPFGAMDKKPVRLLFLLGTPLDAVGDYLKVLAKLTKMLAEEPIRARLLQAADPQAAYDILLEVSNQQEEQAAH
jgi:fructose-specific phosphotransferase system IIA component